MVQTWALNPNSITLLVEKKKKKKRREESLPKSIHSVRVCAAVESQGGNWS